MYIDVFFHHFFLRLVWEPNLLAEQSENRSKSNLLHMINNLIFWFWFLPSLEGLFKSSIYLFIEIVIFIVSDIEDLPRPIQKQLFDELLDRDVQKGEYMYFLYNNAQFLNFI